MDICQLFASYLLVAFLVNDYHSNRAFVTWFREKEY